jgi:hypothetical protein
MLKMALFVDYCRKSGILHGSNYWIHHSASFIPIGQSYCQGSLMRCPLLGHGFGIASSNGRDIGKYREYLWRSMKKKSFISFGSDSR